jgi:hypothetical protein
MNDLLSYKLYKRKKESKEGGGKKKVIQFVIKTHKLAIGCKLKWARLYINIIL